MRRSIHIVLAIAACLVVFTVVVPRTVTAAVPHVSPGDISFTRISLSSTCGPPTTADRVGGVLFSPAEQVTIKFDAATVATVTADGLGKFNASIAIPASALSGRHVITAAGQTSKRHASAPFLVRTDWTMFHFDLAHSGYNPYENEIGPSNVSQLTTKWTATANVTQNTEVAVANGILYAAGYEFDYKVYAFDATTGKTIWTAKTSGINETPAVANGVVYVASFDYHLYAYNALTGSLEWTGTANYPLTNPTVASGYVFVGGTDGILYVFPAAGCGHATCAPLWTANTSHSSTGAPAVTNGLVYVSGSGPNVQAYSVHGCGHPSCQPVWSTQFQYSIDSSPAVAGGRVYVGGDDFNVYALDATTGAVLWHYTTFNAVWSTPAVANGVVYVAPNESTVYALDAVTGKLKWSSPSPDLFNGSAPVVANEVVYVTTALNDLLAFSAADGTLVWSKSNSLATSVAVVNGFVYTADGEIQAFHLP